MPRIRNTRCESFQVFQSYVVLQLLPIYHDKLKVTYDDQINEDSKAVVNTRCTTTNVLSRALGVDTLALFFPLKHISRGKIRSEACVAAFIHSAKFEMPIRNTADTTRCSFDKIHQKALSLLIKHAKSLFFLFVIHDHIKV